MNKLFKNILYIAGLFAIVSFTGCKDDIADEITRLELSRLLSPTDLDVRVINQTSARLTWKAVKNASSYVVEFHENATLDFSGTPVRTVEGVTFNQLPLIVPGFGGETSYSVRVRAMSDDIAESLWIAATFTTDTEQIFLPVDPEEITATGVTLRWPAGEFATHIILEPGSINHPVTEEEVAAGVAEITGLASETEYTAKLMNDTRVRGTAIFTTQIDIGGAIIVTPEDNLPAMIEAANEGDIFALMPGEYNYPGDILVNASIEVVAAVPVEKPVLNGVSFRMFAGAGLRFKDLILDGTTAVTGNQMVIYNEVLPAGQVYGAVLIEDCIIRNYVKGIFYVNIAALIESVNFRGNIIHNIICDGGDFIDFRSGMTRTFNFINNTVYNSAAARDLFRMDGGGSTNFPTENSILTIRNNTFFAVSVASRRILYIRLATHQISVTKNIFAETEANYSNQSLTTVTEMASNNYWNAPNFYINPLLAVYDSGSYTTLNPGFANPAGGNFTVSNADLILFGIGDPRWLP